MKMQYCTEHNGKLNKHLTRIHFYFVILNRKQETNNFWVSRRFYIPFTNKIWGKAWYEYLSAWCLYLILSIYQIVTQVSNHQSSQLVTGLGATQLTITLTVNAKLWLWHLLINFLKTTKVSTNHFHIRILFSWRPKKVLKPVARPWTNNCVLHNVKSDNKTNDE